MFRLGYGGLFISMESLLSRRFALWWLVLLLLLAAWLGIRGLNADAFWMDELWTLHMTQSASPVGVWNQIAAQDPWQSPGYFMLMAVWGSATGWSELAVRVPSLLAGLLGVAFTYRLARDLFSLKAALAAAVTLGASAYFLYYFHEARAYTFYVLFTAMTVWAYRRFTLSGRIVYAALLFLAAASALYVHYFAGLTVVLVAAFHLLFGAPWLKNSGRWWRVNAVFLAAALAFAPWLAVMLRGIAQAGSELAVRGANALTSADMVRGALFLFSNSSTALMVLALVFAVRRGGRVGAIWAWCVGLAGLLLVINALLGVILEIRYLLALWPVFALLVGLGVERLSHKQPSVFGAYLAIWVLAGLWMSLSPEAAVALRNPHWYLPWREWRSVLQNRAGEDDLALVILPDWTWAVYHEDGLAYYLDSLPGEKALVARPENSPVDYAVQFSLSEQASRVWLVSDPSQPLTHLELAGQELEEMGFIQCLVVPDALTNTELFVRAPDASEVPDAVFGAQPEIWAYWAQGSPSADVTLIWSTDARGGGGGGEASLSAGVYLEDRSGLIIAQADTGLPESRFGCIHYRLSLPDGEVAEPLVQSLAVYDWVTGERLAALAGPEGVTTDGRAILRTIHANE